MCHKSLSRALSARDGGSRSTKAFMLTLFSMLLNAS
ncbi:hypothetical protein NRB20_27620 [Nocardia sp. RB20]|uniref:Uncharacterized protein n=1 Tax=Nocardia macrotermitis TaxID=2585198 RepID=A0A7K0D1S8_9NOCA|nr:hypothetical protein [Nocardia macrotermitis]